MNFRSDNTMRNVNWDPSFVITLAEIPSVRTGIAPTCG